MSFALALLGAAWGQQDLLAPCQTFISATMPPAGAIDVPVDLRPLAIVGAGDCAPPESYLLALLENNESGQPVVFDEEITVTQPFTHLALELPAELDPVQDYIFRISPRDGAGEMVEIPFSTGERLTSEVSPGAPVFSVSSATRGSAAEGYHLSYSAVVTGEQDYERLSATFVRDEDGEIVGAALLDGGTFNASVTASWNVADKPKELCLSATQVLANGEESPESEAACAEVQRASGCSSAGGAGGAVSLSLLGLLLMGRRRR
ncbi:MAG: hypothetical protein H6740_20165 [Alphaproteobacteria bacterium]|nr:hypothetical protein [Alphaproteobacteria bacterium]